MTYAATQATIFGKKPVWIYEFGRDGVYTFFLRGPSSFTMTPETFYTDDPLLGDYAFSGVDWDRTTPITHTRFRQTGAIERITTEIVLPGNSQFAQDYFEDLGYEQNSFRLWHGYANDADQEFVLKYRGRVISAKPQWTRIILTCENRITELRSKALSRVMQGSCQNVLYFKPANGPGCGASLASFQVDATASAITGKAVTVAAAASQANGYYTGGVFEFNGKRQMILGHSGSTLTLLNLIEGLADDIGSGGAAVKIAPGCNRSRAHCNDRFGQINNYFGFPWMDQNPFDGRNIY